MPPHPYTRAVVGFLVVVIVLGCGLELRDIASAGGLTLPRFPFPFGRSLFDNLLAVLLATVSAILLTPIFRWHITQNLGCANGWRGPALTLLATVPVWIGLGLQGNIASDLDARSLLCLSLIFPLAEEIVFRGFGFIFTRQRLACPIALAVLVQAALFAMVHWIGAGPGAGGGMALQILIITLFGGIVIAMLDILGRYTIWNGWMTLRINSPQRVIGNVAVSCDSVRGCRPIRVLYGSAELVVNYPDMAQSARRNVRLSRQAPVKG
jgi:CAAX protease family protein